MDEIHNIQCVINALCFDTVEFDLSHISGEQVANGDLYAMEDLLEILTDVYHWIRNDRDDAGKTNKTMRSNRASLTLLVKVIHIGQQPCRQVLIDQVFKRRLLAPRLLN